MSCPTDTLKYKLCVNSSSVDEYPDAAKITVANECLNVRIVEDHLKVKVTEVIYLGSGGQGGSADNLYTEAIAEINLGSLRVVTTSSTSFGKVTYADHNNLSQASNILGITRTSAVPDGSVDIITSGMLSDSSWNFNEGPIFVGVNGQLTQIAPTTGYIVVVGKAVSSTRISINISRPIILN